MNKIGILLNKHGTWVVLCLSIVAAIGATAYFYAHNEILGYNDALSRLDIARMVTDSQTPGIVQLGGIWLPLNEFLMVPFTANDLLWRSGLAGSIVSGMALVISSLYVYKIVQLLTKKAWLGVTGSLLMILNINILYMSTTAMAEMFLIATLLGAIFHFLKWLDGKRLPHLILASLWVALATLVRYEGWLTAFMCIGIIVIEYLIVNKDREKAQSYAVLFGTLGLFGILLWLIWNMLFWNNPFYFLTAGNGQFSPSGVTNLYAPTRHNLTLSIITLLKAMWLNLGALLFALLPGSLIALFLKGNRKLISYAIVLLAVPVAVNLMTLFLGITGITADSHINSLNVRYGITSVMLVAIVLPTAIGKLHKLLRPALAIAVIIACLFIPSWYQYATDVTGNDSSSNAQINAFVDNFIKTYKGGRILSSASGLFNPIQHQIGLPLRNYTIEGNWHIWDLTLLDPHKASINYIFMATNGESGRQADPVYQAYQRNRKVYDKYYVLTYQSAAYSLYTARNIVTTARGGTSLLNIARAYSGELYNVPLDLTTKISLVRIQQSQSNIRGYFTGFQVNGLQVNEPFSGMIDAQRHFHFTVTEYGGQIMLSFDGSVQSDGPIAGNYCSLDQQGQCAGEYGVWEVVPVSEGGYR